MKHMIDSFFKAHRQLMQRRAPDGRFETATDQVRRDIIQGNNIQELMKLQEPYEGNRELISMEGCAVI
jgi:hypothetical protein